MLPELTFRKEAAHMFIDIDFLYTNFQLPDHLTHPELFELVTTYQVHAHSRTC